MTEKKKFRLLTGKFVSDERDGEGKRKSYRVGDVVESTEDLVKKFQNKFEKVENTTSTEE